MSMGAADTKLITFGYRAQTVDGSPVEGTVQAADADAARWRLQGFGLRVVEMEPAPGSAQALSEGGRGAAIRGDDFVAFNQQLASLTKAGLPLERGLRLIAEDMRSGELAATVRGVAEELENGKPLGEAMAAHAGKFPPLYGRMLEAGVKSGNLPGVLMGLSAHLELVQRLRESVWRAVSYPLVVLLTTAGLLMFLSMPGGVIEQMLRVSDSRAGLPLLSEVVFSTAEAMPMVLLAGALLLIGAVIGWRVAWRRPRARAWLERVLLATPLIGPVVRRGLVTRWADGVRMGVESGMDLPGAMEMAAEATASPALELDARALATAHGVGVAANTVTGLRVLPMTVLVAIELGVGRGDLAGLMASVRDNYRQQTEHRLVIMRGVLRPMLLVIVGGVIGLVIAAIFLPILRLIDAVTLGIFR
jgi:type II secretory pathway component PulF